MFTRRALLLNSSAAAMSNLIARASAQAAVQRTRFSAASTEGKKMLRTYAQAVKQMKAWGAQEKFSWQFQWYIHATPIPAAEMLNRVYPGGSGATYELALATWYTCQAHLRQPEDYFLPWHRLYVMAFEQIIRDVTHDQDFTLPYWDYTSPASYAIPEEFQTRNSRDPTYSSLFVSNRNKDDGVQYADVNAGAPLNKYLTGSANFLVLPPLKRVSYSSFCSQLDGNLHGAVHVFTGDATNMGTVPTAANDPVFWLHHCNIDRIWAAWSASGGKTPTSTNGINWSDTYFGFPTSKDDKPERTAISAIADISKLPYKYDSLPGVPTGVAPGLAEAQMEVVQKSISPRAEATASAGAAPSPPISLGAAPSRVPLAATSNQNRLSGLVPGLGEARITLLLKDVQARADPNTVYQIFLDLPENATPELKEQHYAGLLNFFGVAPPPGRDALGGRDVEIDVTEVVKRLQAKAALQDESSVTLIPLRSPSEASSPTIDGGIALLRH